jgi:hypothetical protein
MSTEKREAKSNAVFKVSSHDLTTGIEKNSRTPKAHSKSNYKLGKSHRILPWKSDHLAK